MAFPPLAPVTMPLSFALKAGELYCSDDKLGTVVGFGFQMVGGNAGKQVAKRYDFNSSVRSSEVGSFIGGEVYDSVFD
jgi:hypothetical protein